MIEYLQHNEINKQKWDNCIANAENALVYAMSWYLDIVSPNWDALVLDDYKAVMPLTWRRKWGIKYIFIPPVTQQLGLFYLQSVKHNVDIDAFISKIPDSFCIIDIKLNYLNLPAYIKTNKNDNYILNLNNTYVNISKTFSKNHKKNINSANNKFLKFEKSQSVDTFISFFKEHTLNKIADYDKNINSALLQITNYTLNKGNGFLYKVSTEKNEILSIAFFLQFENVYYLLADATKEKGRKNRAKYFLINEFIKLHSSSNSILDFEGSNIPSIAYFNKGFGAKKVSYYSFRHVQVPSILKLFKKQSLKKQ